MEPQLSAAHRAQRTRASGALMAERLVALKMYLLFAAHVRAEILPIGIGVVVKNTVSVWCLRALRLENGNTQRNCLGARRPRRAGHTC